MRFDDIAAVGRDHETFSSKRSIILVDKLSADPDEPDPMDIAQHMMITQDPPRHDRMKALVQRAFTPKRALEHTERMREIINLVYDRALERHPDGRVDLVQDVGLYVPSMVIGDMLGAPREDAEQLVDWTNRTTAFEDPRLVPDLGEVWRALEEFMPYVNDDDRASARPTPTDDLTTALIEAEVDGERLAARRDPHVLLPADGGRQRLDAGGLHLRDEEPDRRSRADGARAVGRGPARAGRRGVRALQPRVRLHAPHRDTRRRARRHGRSRPATSSRSGTSRATATPSVFDDPHRFDVRRDPNPHQGFGGGGRHFCLGAGLARLELKLWIEETLRRFPDIELDGDGDRVSSTFLNQYRTMPVSIG